MGVAQRRIDLAELPKYRLIRIDTVTNVVRVEYVDKAGKESLSPLMPFDGTIEGLMETLMGLEDSLTLKEKVRNLK